MSDIRYPAQVAPFFELHSASELGLGPNDVTFQCHVFRWGIGFPIRKEPFWSTAQWQDITQIGPISNFTSGIALPNHGVMTSSGPTSYFLRVDLADGRFVVFSHDYRFGWPTLPRKNLKPVQGTIKRVNIVQLRRILERAVASGQLA